jgi:hypothetical protein
MEYDMHLMQLSWTMKMKKWLLVYSLRYTLDIHKDDLDSENKNEAIWGTIFICEKSGNGNEAKLDPIMFSF